jgi:hypothetical protein
LRLLAKLTFENPVKQRIELLRLDGRRTGFCSYGSAAEGDARDTGEKFPAPDQ